jgi:hypothetical protein
MKPLTTEIQDLQKLQEAHDAEVFSVEQMLFGWLFSSDNPSREWETVQKCQKDKLTVFGRKTLDLLRLAFVSKSSTPYWPMYAVLNSTRDRFYNLWMLRCLRAGSCYALTGPTATDKKRMGIV